MINESNFSLALLNNKICQNKQKSQFTAILSTEYIKWNKKAYINATIKC